MIKKTSPKKNKSQNNNTETLIKSLGGAQKVYKHLLAKNNNITIESIYKWKKNGIPYRYRADIKELSAMNNIKLTDNAFLDNKETQKEKAEIISELNQKKQIFLKKNIALYLLIIFPIFLLIYIYYAHTNITKLEKKIIEMEEIVSSKLMSDAKEEINSIHVMNKEQNKLIKSNTLKIEDLNTVSQSIKGLVNKIEKETSNILLDQGQSINSKQLNSINILLYLIDIKNDIKFSNPNLNQFNRIKSYLNNVNKPQYAILALNQLNKLSKIELKSHNSIINEVNNKVLIYNNVSNNKNDTKKTLLNKFKNLVKVSKIDTDTVNYKNKFDSKIINLLNNHNYEKSIYELNLINKNGELNKIIQDLNNLKILYESINVIIKWLIFEG
jgi:hypothetical protein